MANDKPLGVEIQRIRDRLRAMRAEREAAMRRLAVSREHAEAQRQVRADAENERDVAPGSPPQFVP